MGAGFIVQYSLLYCSSAAVGTECSLVYMCTQVQKLGELGALGEMIEWHEGDSYESYIVHSSIVFSDFAACNSSAKVLYAYRESLHR
jgi:hypothetical protein